MDDFWGVIWGAGIALFAAIAGGLLTAVVGPALSRRAEDRARQEERRVVAYDEKRRVLRETVHALDEALRLWVEALGTNRRLDVDLHRGQAREALVRLRLWTTEEERSVGDLAVNVLSAEGVWNAVHCYRAWSDVAVAWFRDTVPSKDVRAEYERVLEATKADIDRARRRNEKPGTKA